MDERTYNALLGSIKKWEDIRDGKTDDRGTSNCPLCREFFDNVCEDCPVKNKTGKSSCYDTPYWDYREFQEENAEGPDGTYPSFFTDEKLVERRRELAQAEIDFLTSLLPNEDEDEVDNVEWNIEDIKEL